MSWRDGGHDDEDDEPHGLDASESPTALCLSDYHNSVIPTEAGLLQPDLLKKSLQFGDLKSNTETNWCLLCYFSN